MENMEYKIVNSQLEQAINRLKKLFPDKPYALNYERAASAVKVKEMTRKNLKFSQIIYLDQIVYQKRFNQFYELEEMFFIINFMIFWTLNLILGTPWWIAENVLLTILLLITLISGDLYLLGLQYRRWKLVKSLSRSDFNYIKSEESLIRSIQLHRTWNFYFNQILMAITIINFLYVFIFVSVEDLNLHQITRRMVIPLIFGAGGVVTGMQQLTTINVKMQKVVEESIANI